MATYSDLVHDVRALAPELSRSVASDKQIARLVWRSLQRMVRRATELSPDDNRLARTSAALTVPADLTAGMTLPTMIKPLSFEVRYSTGHRLPLTLVAAFMRWDEIRPLPAAFIQNDKLYPLSGSGGRAEWTDASMEKSDWKDASTVQIEYIPDVTEPTAMTSSITVNDLFHDVAVHDAASSLVREPGRTPFLTALRQEKEMEVLGSLRREPAGMNRVREVW